MPFNYEWQVDDAYSGNVFNHGSKSDGDVTEGEYRVLLPDGRTQVNFEFQCFLKTENPGNLVFCT